MKKIKFVPDPQATAEENSRNKKIFQHLSRRNSGKLRDRLYEKYPPQFGIHDELEMLRRDMVERLKRRGFSLRQIDRMSKTLENIPSDCEAQRARQSLFFISRFKLAWKRQHWNHAAYFACQAGRDAQKCIAYDENKLLPDFGRLQRTRGFQRRNAQIMKLVAAKLNEWLGRGSMQKLYNALQISERYLNRSGRPMAPSTFFAILRRGDWLKIKNETRKKFIV